MKAPTPEDLAALAAAAGPGAVLDAAATAPLLEEWRGRWHGTTPLALAPATTAAVAAVMTEAAARRLAIVPQGGNTGLVGGQTPHGQILLSTRRLQAIRAVDAAGFTLSAEAGVTLHTLRATADAAGRRFPLSISAEGTAQLGGLLSTNAGGVQALRHGSMRALTLGLEVVLPDGRVLDLMNRLRKNNTGYDLKQLFIGAEGTLGVITAAVVRLVAQAPDRAVALASLRAAEDAIRLLGFVETEAGASVDAFELMNAATAGLVIRHFPATDPGLAAMPAYLVLIELVGDTTCTERLENLLARASTDGLIDDAVLARSEAQAGRLWALRHNASAAMKAEPAACVKCDIAVPVAAVPAFLHAAEAMIARLAPEARIIAFGHVGDGNIHFDVLGPEAAPRALFAVRSAEIERAVHDVALAHGGTISAEHGIGRLKRDELAARQDPVAQDVMRALKATLDPDGRMNPGALL